MSTPTNTDPPVEELADEAIEVMQKIYKAKDHLDEADKELLDLIKKLKSKGQRTSGTSKLLGSTRTSV